MSNNASDLAISIPNQADYGAKELKEIIKKYTLRGVIITTLLCALLLLFYVGIQKAQESADKAPVLAPIVKISVEQLPQQTDDSQVAPPPQEMIVTNSGPAARAGNPVPVPDAMITADMKEFATVDVMSRASSVGGDGVDIGSFAANIDHNKDKVVKIETKEEEPAIDEFIPVEKEPSFDMAKLHKLIEYPEMAKKAGIEGRVTLRILVGADGSIKRTVVESSDHSYLNKAAEDAIKKYGKANPAIQNNQSVPCWVSIPINFKLR